MSNRIVHFEIHAEDPERAIKFYASCFNWRFKKWDGPMEYWLVMTGEGKGIDGGLMRRKGPAPTDGAPMNGYGCVVDVSDVDKAIADVKACGGKIVVEKSELPGVGFFAGCKDTEGNIFSMMQSMMKNES